MKFLVDYWFGILTLLTAQQAIAFLFGHHFKFHPAKHINKNQGFFKFDYRHRNVDKTANLFCGSLVFIAAWVALMFLCGIGLLAKESSTYIVLLWTILPVFLQMLAAVISGLPREIHLLPCTLGVITGVYSLMWAIADPLFSLLLQAEYKAGYFAILGFLPVFPLLICKFAIEQSDRFFKEYVSRKEEATIIVINATNITATLFAAILGLLYSVYGLLLLTETSL